MSNQVDYFEIGTPNAGAARRFYGDLFHWKIDEQASPEGYRMIDQSKGGLWETSDAHASGWAIFYVHVDDVADAVQRAVSLGATVAIPLTSTPDIDFAHLVDPDGNRFGVWKPAGA